MSHVATAWAYRQDIPSAGRKFTLVALADFADELWSCYPGQDRLAAMTGQTSRSVRAHLLRLESDGLIERTARHLSNGQRTSDRYRLLAGVVESVAQPAEESSAGQVLSHRKSTQGQPEDLSGEPLVNQEHPPTPASGGADHCTRHTRHRKSCNACVAAWVAFKAKPPWCGSCLEETRMTDEDRPRRCPDCHPLTVERKQA